MKHYHLHSSYRYALHVVLLLVLLWTGSAAPAYASGAAPAQPAASAWYDGAIQYSTITNCASIIQGSPYLEQGAGTYIGFLADPVARNPAPNVVYYVHIVVAGLGNSCSGIRAYLDIGLPANTSLAIDGTHPVYCFYDAGLLSSSECPQALPNSSYNSGMYEIPSVDNAHANTWPIPQGKFLEIQIPVKSSTALSGSPMQAKVWMLDGNNSPWLQPKVGVYVFSNQTTILYNNPSTTSIQSTAAHSEAFLYSNGLGGTGYFDLGTDTSYNLGQSPVTIPAGWYATKAWVDWSLLQPDTLYHWRFKFNSGNVWTYGDDQTFHTPAVGVASVGSGITGSCTEAALLNALATAKLVTFACGPLPATIQLSAASSINTTVTVDGGGMVTLSTQGKSNHFNVQAGAHLTLNRIKLVGGSNQGACGGSIHVYGNGSLTLTEASFDRNITAARGGAVCIDAQGSADIHSTLFTNNQANHGGGVFNGGTLTIEHSNFITNTASYHGGALQNYGTGVVSDTTFDHNIAAVNGGGIDAGGTLTVNHSTFTTNTSGVRGGGINDYVGTLNVTGSSFNGNHSDGYGGGIANDEGTVTIQTSTFSTNSAKSVGGGLRSNGTTHVTNSTFSANHADGDGGGIENSQASATLALLNTTLSGNTAGGQGGNLFIGSAASAHLTVKNTIIASGSPNNCDHQVSSQGYNLESANTCGLAATGDRVSTNPKLGPLQNNGGPTSTLALLDGSPAIDAGTNSGCPATDQRGVARPLDGDGDGKAVCDTGAYEHAAVSHRASLYLPLLKK